MTRQGQLSRRALLAATAAIGATTGALSGCASSSDRSAAEIVFLAGYENHPGEPIHDGMMRWAELLEERSNGTMRMELYPSSQLGSKSDLIDQMYAGAPVITLADGAFYADQGVPDFGITFAPYLFDDWDQAWRLTESEWYARQSALLADKGLHLLTSKWKYGDRHTLLTRRIDGVAGLRGLKVRVPGNIIQIKGFEALGATPTPMPLGDVYTALQQGTIDGLENPVPVLQNGRFHEVATFLILDAHVRNFTTWLTAQATFESLTPEQRELISSTGDEASVFNNELQDQKYEESLQAMTDGGVEVLPLDIAEFRERAQSFYAMPEITSMWSPGLYETVREAMQS